MAMTRLAQRNDLAVQHVERGKQGGGAVAIIIVGNPLEITQAHWQNRCVRSNACTWLFSSGASRATILA
jgi:hypothetical protein